MHLKQRRSTWASMHPNPGNAFVLVLVLTHAQSAGVPVRPLRLRQQLGHGQAMASRANLVASASCAAVGITATLTARKFSWPAC